MKKIFSFLLLWLCVTTSSHAQKLVVPAEVSSAFAAKFPAAKEVKWEKENSKELEANFMLNNAKVSANFGLDGSWKETETTIPASDLPPAITGAIQTKYPGAAIVLAERIEKPGNKISYEVNIKMNGRKKELEMDSNGKVIE